MEEKYYKEIKESEALIEEKRLTIKEIKKHIVKLKSKIEITGNIYEYFAIPSCAVSLILISLFNGLIIYVLPTFTALGAISAIVYKFLLKKQIEKWNLELDKLKKDRKEAYDNRERVFENIFSDLQNKNLDTNDYYHQIVSISNKCDNLTESMVPYKEKRAKLEKKREIFHKLFDYVLAPLGAVALPLFCSFVNVGAVVEAIAVTISSAALLASATVDEKLTEKIDELTRFINDIKSDRTVNYIKRDLKLSESLDYLQSTSKINV